MGANFKLLGSPVASDLDILFINPASENAFGFIQAAHRPGFNLGTGYLAAYCIQEGFRADVVDMGAEGVSIEQLLSIIREKKPAVIGISIVTLLMDISVKIAHAIKKMDESLPIVVGGPHPSALPEQTLMEGPFDVVVLGEGEVTCVRLLERILDNRALEGLKGIVYRNGDVSVSGGLADRIDDLDSLPFPYRKPATLGLYKNMVYFDEPNARMYNLISTRGCPYKCTFCGQSVVFPRKVRRRSAENVFSEMEMAFRDLGIRYFFFEDSTFVFNRKVVEKLCQLIIRNGLRLKWGATGRLDLVDEGFYRLMEEAGCNFLFFGVESGNDGVLKSIRKMFDLSTARKAIKIVKNLGIPFNTSFILGLPEDSMESMEETIRFAIELNADYVSFSLATPYPGSALYDSVTGNGWTVEKWADYEKSRYNEPVYIPPGVSRDDLVHMFHRAYKRFYLRPAYALNHLKRIRSLGQFIHHCRLGWSLLKGR